MRGAVFRYRVTPQGLLSPAPASKRGLSFFIASRASASSFFIEQDRCSARPTQSGSSALVLHAPGYSTPCACLPGCAHQYCIAQQNDSRHGNDANSNWTHESFWQCTRYCKSDVAILLGNDRRTGSDALLILTKLCTAQGCCLALAKICSTSQVSCMT